MGTMKTCIVKFIRKGDAGYNVIVAETYARNFTYAQWQTYGATGHLENWVSVTNAAKFKPGDTIVIVGVCTDRNNAGVNLYATVVSVSGTTVSATTSSLIMGGEKGPTGSRGPALRGPQAWSDCANGYAFKSGAEGEEWKDVVLYGDKYWSCIVSHTKTASNYPSASSSYWRVADSIELVATKILLATYALVKNLGVEAIDMKDASGNILFQAKDGNVTCKTGTFNNITVASGRVAGFKISGNGLTNADDNGAFTNDAYIIFRNDNRNAFAGIGGNVLPASSGARAVARFENHDEGDFWGLGTNYGMLLSARGMQKNIALQMDGGAVSGLALNTTIIGTSITSKTLARTDTHVICINKNECTITLPTMQLYDDGHIIRIKWLGAKVKFSLGYCYTYNGTSYRYTKPCLIYDENSTLTGANTLDDSTPNRSMELVWVRDIIRTVGTATYYGAWVQYKYPRAW